MRALKTHCARGHAYTKENTVWRKIRGCLSQCCRTCKREGDRRRYPSKEKTHCGRGHLFDEQNTYWKKYGVSRFRICLTCKREWARRRAKPRVVKCVVVPKPLPPRETIAITYSEVPEFYALLGWRFIGFKGDLCMFEWQSEREPRWPEQMREAA